MGILDWWGASVPTYNDDALVQSHRTYILTQFPWGGIGVKDFGVIMEE